MRRRLIDDVVFSPIAEAFVSLLFLPTTLSGAPCHCIQFVHAVARLSALQVPQIRTSHMPIFLLLSLAWCQ